MADDADDRESPESSRRPTQADLRADYDDDYGRVRTSRQIARRRLRIPAIDFLILGVSGLVASLTAAIFVIVDRIEDAADPLEYLEMVGLLTLTGLGGALSALIVAAGDGMLRLRRHRVALIGSYVVASLSLASVYAILFYPFGIWALILLYKTEVRREFDRPEDPAARSDAGALRFSSVMLMVGGGIGFAIMLLTFAAIAWDATVGGHWTDSELIWCYGLTLIAAGAFAALLVRGFVLKRRMIHHKTIAQG